jgi:hypothetical protein
VNANVGVQTHRAPTSIRSSLGAVSRPTVPTPPLPVVQASVEPDPESDRAWWDWWHSLPVVERRRPAADVREADDV